MKRQEKERHAQEKGQITLTMEIALIKVLERRAEDTGSTPSRVMADLVRRHVFQEEAWYTEMAKYHSGKMYEYLFQRDQCRAAREIIEAEKERPKVLEVAHGRP